MADVETIDSNDEAEETGKPLLLLFKRLICNRPEQNTVLSNQQILQILKEEFNINFEEIHDLEVDIYLNVMKRFLKEWPQWEDFDKTISRLRSNNDKAGIERLLQTKTNNLREYIKTMLEISSTMAKAAVSEAEQNKEFKKKEEKAKRNPNPNKDDDDVVLEISCTRSQLNKLILNHPGKDSVFNVEYEIPSTICFTSVSMQTILNWWGINVYVSLPSFCYRRETAHELKHVLVNKKLKHPTMWSKLDTCLQEKTVVKPTEISKKQFEKSLEVISKTLQNTSMSTIFYIIVRLLKEDFNCSPNELKIHAMYRRYMNRFPYVRYLYSDVKVEENSNDANKYDLQLEETIYPMYQLHLLKLEESKLKETPREHDVIYIECKICHLKYNGGELAALNQHFLDYHQNEPDWHCTFCQKKFNMIDLAENRWFHNCI